VNTIPAERQNRNNKALLKALVFAAIIILAILSVRVTPLGHYISAAALQNQLDKVGMWAPLAFIVFYALAICIFVPGTVLTGIGAAIFGPYLGFLYVWTGAMIGAVMAFFVSRTLGREFAESLVAEKLKKYDEAIERNGFATVLYLRLIYSPFAVTNFAMGMTRVRFWDYFFGTALGIIVGTFIFSFLIGTLIEIWTSGNWNGLAPFKFFFSVCLFILSLFIPKAIKKMKGEG
jgi:uncharacterized membrane protein YdjX (TVP38/TMEM64 family)